MPEPEIRKRGRPKKFPPENLAEKA